MVWFYLVFCVFCLSFVFLFSRSIRWHGRSLPLTAIFFLLQSVLMQEQFQRSKAVANSALAFLVPATALFLQVTKINRNNCISSVAAWSFAFLGVIFKFPEFWDDAIEQLTIKSSRENKTWMLNKRKKASQHTIFFSPTVAKKQWQANFSFAFHIISQKFFSSSCISFLFRALDSRVPFAHVKLLSTPLWHMGLSERSHQNLASLSAAATCKLSITFSLTH